MKKQDFYFELPQELIAQYPLPNRSDSRLLYYNRKQAAYQHQQFKNLSELLEPDDLLVLNNTKVIPARFFGTKSTGGKVEFLIERRMADNQFLAHIKASKTPKNGSLIQLEKAWQVEVLDKLDDLYLCRSLGDLDCLLQEVGHIPLPLYITREDEQADEERYQTVYAKHEGSVAAPTAGLHFDEFVISQLQEKGIRLMDVTLHVGAGTFRPVRCDDIRDHKMHREQFEVSEAVCEAVSETRQRGGRVIAVGTTAMRTLESAARDGYLKACKGETDIFIYPGYQFKVCDGLITNFHLPESTLLMLVSAFLGREQTMALYEEAIARRYRFYSYGDATLLL
ncbi:tRNA preQ1(34) S-adenosylmethionine ribosyltransferase-isomerase QueA [Legionella sp. 16cNR16C]|uniref:tRNA preQ1(34) S-adenosylmethionine ribosyltransferase-isomerase QueA n=1 Tax=Legionella sp. 16cNR16C TaxID=2905656 RepID=UPI001E634DD8|nr:tRNA preQ1(34) S-adenosylmethionine ribosyltransferase-isomerase QueA [Legionella sp. 16cNR16C]MCE3044309.1 tRNA preQ1(34) S-adenosylmethionine ribosyltransferase-isomerase QueA [Legionella sp. 16cNR16C]